MRRPLQLIETKVPRRIPRSFGWADHAVRGYLKLLNPTEIALYFFLVLAADRQGLSCWRVERIARELGDLDFGDLFEARETLLSLRLIAFRPWSAHEVDGIYQLLPVPPGPSEAVSCSPFGREGGL